MRKAVCPGSFDPITNGHLDIIERTSRLFDDVTVLVVINPEKKPAFTPQERMDMISRVTSHLDNVHVDCYYGLLVDYIKEKNITTIVKGLRVMTDFEYELQMAMTNRTLYPEAETLFLTAKQKNMYLSSSLVKQVAAFKGDISSFIPMSIYDDIYNRLTPGE